MAYYQPINKNKHTAFKLLVDLFDEVVIIDVREFIRENKYNPDIASIFVVSTGGSYSYMLDNVWCAVSNGTLSHYGYLQIQELQHAYLTNTAPDLPKGTTVGMGIGCPKCKQVTYAKKDVVLCQFCKCMYYV